MNLSNPVGALFLTASLAGMYLTPSAQAVTAEASANNAPSVTEVAPAPQTPPALRFSPGIQEILKMLDAKVDVEVIKVYIKNSTAPYNPSASEIIALKQRGVPDELVAALLQRGAEVRAQAVSAGQLAPATAPVSPPAYAPYAADMAPYASDYYDYGSPYYAGYTYGYPYPYNYWWYNYGYPWWGFYSPFFYVDAFGHHHFHDFDHHGHAGDFHGHGRFHNSPNHSSAPFGTFAGRNAGFSGNRTMSPFGTFAPHRTGFAAGTSAFRPAMVGGSRPGSFAGHAGGFRSGAAFASRGGGFGGHGGRGGHR
jgi:hypothetical protein